MREHVSQSKKANTASFSIPSLKHRIPGFGLDSSQASPQAVPLVQPLHKPLTHDISRIPLRSPQAKLSISQPGDKYEQEADSVAQQVMQRIAQPINRQSIQPEAMPEESELQMKPLANSITPVLQRQSALGDESELQMKSLDNSTLQRQEVPEDESELQMKPMVQRRAEARINAAPDIEASINQARGGGQPMADNIRHPMEVAFSTDFSGVKVHTDSQSDQLNRSIQARAFTTGQDVFFRQGEYNPGSRGGQELLAHELTHVVQQNGGAVQRSSLNSLQQSSASASNGGIALVQRASLNSIERLSWDETGKEMWSANPSDPSPIAQHINRLVKEGVLNTTNVSEFVSGHAIAAAMGGKNHETNIVGWDGNTHEIKQTEFEWAVLKGQRSTYTDALPPQANETGQIIVEAQLYGDEKWQLILDEWAMTLKNHVVANWAELKANGKAEINPKIPVEKRTNINDPSEEAILQGIKNSLKAGGHSLERVKRIPNDYRISYAPTSKKSGREFELNQENLPKVELNKSADINTLFEMAKPPKAISISIAPWFLYSPTP
ncbi:eCIS core domain-containing protein [Nostoc sp.]|uniref:eCIS core domain-containing protein n=1 Tax=Nostoc sp. TaxID=1180 RepID=UPI002FF81E0B